jgi:hypothetical protein
MTEWPERVQNFKVGGCIVTSKCPLPIMYDAYAHWIRKTLCVEDICAWNGTRVVVNVPDDYSKSVFDRHKSKSRYAELILCRVGTGLTSEEKKLAVNNLVNMVIRADDEYS